MGIRTRSALVGIFGLMAAVVASPAFAYQDQPFVQTEAVDNEPLPLRVRYFAGAVTVQRAHAGETAAALVNLPLDAGDRLWSDSRGRIELAMHDGTILWVGGDATIDILALPGGLGGETLLRLWTGSVIVRRPDGTDPRFPLRIDMPHGSARLEDPGLYRLDFDSERRAWLSVFSGGAEFAAGGMADWLVAGQRVFAEAGTAPSEPVAFNTAERDDLSEWQSGRLAAVAEAERYVQSRGYVPRTVVYQAAELEPYGDWVYHGDFEAWAWRPTVGISVGWSPYRDGRWVYGYRGWSWVSSSSWGWVTGHYGRWHHLPAYGWVWFPGAVYSPAWVSWYVGGGYVGWCPIGYYGRPFISVGQWFGGYYGYGHGYHGRYDYRYPGYGQGGYAVPRGKVVAGRGYTQGGRDIGGWSLVRSDDLGGRGVAVVERTAVPRGSVNSVSLQGPLRPRDPSVLVAGSGRPSVSSGGGIAVPRSVTGSDAVSSRPGRTAVVRPADSAAPSSGPRAATVRPRPSDSTARTPAVRPRSDGESSLRPSVSSPVRPRSSAVGSVPRPSTSVRPRPSVSAQPRVGAGVAPRPTTNASPRPTASLSPRRPVTGSAPRPAGAATLRPRPAISRPVPAATSSGGYRSPVIAPRSSSARPSSPPRVAAPRSGPSPSARGSVGSARPSSSRPPAAARSAPRSSRGGAPARGSAKPRGTAKPRGW